MYKRGIWASWSDSHICLTQTGRCQMLIHSRGLPWQYSTQGILTRSKFAAKQRIADAEEEATGDELAEKDAKAVREEVASGMYGPVGLPPTPSFPPDKNIRTPERTNACCPNTCNNPSTSNVPTWEDQEEGLARLKRMPLTPSQSQMTQRGWHQRIHVCLQTVKNQYAKDRQKCEAFAWAKCSRKCYCLRRVAGGRALFA